MKKVFFSLFILNIFTTSFAMEIKLPSETDTPGNERQFVDSIANFEPGQLIFTRKKDDDKKESWRFITGASVYHTLSHEGKDALTPEYYFLLKSANEPNKYLLVIKELSSIGLYHETHQGAKLNVPDYIRSLKVNNDAILSNVQSHGLNKIECLDETKKSEQHFYDMQTSKIEAARIKGYASFVYQDPQSKNKRSEQFTISKDTFDKRTGNGIIIYSRSRGLFSPYQIERTEIFVNPDGNAKNPNNCAYSFDWNHNALNWRKIIAVSTAAATTAGILGATYLKWFKKK